MEYHTRSVRIPHDLNDFLRQERIRISRQRGYRKSVNALIIDLVRHAKNSKPKDRPWNW